MSLIIIFLSEARSLLPDPTQDTTRSFVVTCPWLRWHLSLVSYFPAVGADRFHQSQPVLTLVAAGGGSVMFPLSVLSPQEVHASEHTSGQAALPALRESLDSSAQETRLGSIYSFIQFLYDSWMFILWTTTRLHCIYFLAPLPQTWRLGAPAGGCWAPFCSPGVGAVFVGFGTSMLPGATRCSRFLSHTSCPSSTRSHFSKDRWTLWLDKCVSNQGLGSRHAHCF